MPVDDYDVASDDVRECANAISDFLDGCDLVVGFNGLLLVTTTFIMSAPDPIEALDDAVETLRRNTFRHLTPKEGERLH